jgi:hypothetical protein
MPAELLPARSFSFTERPLPIPGDLRLSWRIPVLLLMLFHSRQNRGSLIKLHVLSDAIGSLAATERLEQILKKELPPLFWQPRIEPAFARAIDFAVGDGLVTWVTMTTGAGLVLSQGGHAGALQVIDIAGVLTAEKPTIARLAKAVTEGFIRDLISASRHT